MTWLPLREGSSVMSKPSPRMVTKPVTGLRSVLAGLGYGMKYLLKRDGSREEYEDEEDR